MLAGSAAEMVLVNEQRPDKSSGLFVFGEDGPVALGICRGGGGAVVRHESGRCSVR